MRTRVNQLDSVNDLFAFACRCLKDPDLNDAFRFFCFEDVHSHAISEELVHSCVYLEEEHPDFERDLALFEATTCFAGLRPGPTEPIELTGEQTQFPCSLRASCGVIDLD